jgi:hypothetical protein
MSKSWQKDGKKMSKNLFAFGKGLEDGRSRGKQSVNQRPKVEG